jgi:hypothetical protein
MSRVRSGLEHLGAWLGVSGHLDDLLGVPGVWRALRGIVAVIAAFVAAMWPDVQEAILRAVLALLSVGAVGWLFNLGFWITWRRNYDSIKTVQRLLREAADLVGTPTAGAGTEEAVRRGWQWGKAREFMRHVLSHSAVSDFESFLKIEETRLKELEQPFSAFTVTANYLRRLADNLKASDVDIRNTVMPNTFKQYAETDKWPGID